MKLMNLKVFLLLACVVNTMQSCEKDDEVKSEPTKNYPSEVAIQWMAMQVKQMREYPPVVGNAAYARQYAYSGITLYEAVVHGMPSFQSIAPQLNGLGELPKPVAGEQYHWAASANAALAFINRKIFPDASADNKAAMDALESSLQQAFSKEADAATISRSVDYGKKIAQAVYDWSEKDGYQKINDPYTSPTEKSGGVYWTAPNPLPVHCLPYYGNVRRTVASSGNGAEAPAPDYTKLKDWTIEVINAKPAVGTDEYQMAFWWRDFPGTSTPGHYVSILRQVLQKRQPSLDVAAYAYALGGITVLDIAITTWQDKFKYLLARPFNYDDVIGQPFTSWLSAPHPEYPAAHASVSMANAEAMTTVFGDNIAFTDSTFFGLVTPQNVTLAPRSYPSFRKAGEEAGLSRLYGGIHYKYSIDIGYAQGKKVAENIRQTVKFKK